MIDKILLIMEYIPIIKDVLLRCRKYRLNKIEKES